MGFIDTLLPDGRGRKTRKTRMLAIMIISMTSSITLLVLSVALSGALSAFVIEHSMP
jgi:hypothetical protein